jgi:hypothetical protein
MTTRRTVASLSLVFAAVVASLVVLTATARADSKTIRFTEPVTIGTTVLKAGTYTVSWVGNGPEVQVSFMKGDKVVATAQARLVFEKNPHGRSISTITRPDNSKILIRLSFSSKALIFEETGFPGEAAK